jgi:hypothetical protein
LKQPRHALFVVPLARRSYFIYRFNQKLFPSGFQLAADLNARVVPVLRFSAPPLEVNGLNLGKNFSRLLDNGCHKRPKLFE